MKTNKTVREWLEELPEPYRTQAIENNVREGKVDLDEEEEEDSMWWALAGAFIWDESPQGHRYWSNLAEQYEQNS